MKTYRLNLCMALLCAAIASRAHAQTLGQALNATNLVWTTSGTGGAVPWFAETTTTHDGVAAAQSGRPSSSTATSTLQTTVTGPGTITFSWNNTSVYRTLTFSVGGATLALLPRSTWRQQTNYLGSGTQTLSWIYSLAGPAPGDEYYGYLDEVNFTSGTTAPFITTQPSTQSQPPGGDALFVVEASGTPPLSYQWRLEGTDIPGATASSLKVISPQLHDLGNYSVLVTNSAGSILSSNALLGVGQVAAWGDPTRGGTACPLGLSNVLAVAGGDYFSLALKTDGSLAIWGYSYSGQLTLPPDLTNAQSIAAGSSHAAALKPDGTVTAWGSDAFGQTNAPKGLSNVVAIAGGDFTTLALRSDGTIAAWGDFNAGLTNLPSDLTNVTGLTADGTFALALRADGTATRWGAAGPALPTNLTGVAAISVHGFHGIALLQDSTVRAWGQNDWGQATVPAGLSNVVAIAAGFYHSIALRADGTVVAWGDNRYGQTNVPPGLKNVVAIAAGLYHNLALVGDGPPRLQVPTAPSLSGAAFRVSIPSQSGRVYALEHVDSLAGSNWTALPLVAGNGTNICLTDPLAAEASPRFYRVRRW